MSWRGPLVGLVLLGGVGAVAAGVRPVDREAWLEDYHQLRDHMAVAYANLDWMIESGRVDVRALDSATEARIRAARTDREARRAVRDFLTAFHDGHVAEEREAPRAVQLATAWWKSRKHGSDTRPARSWSGADACSALGYSDGESGWSLPFQKQAGFHDLADIGPIRAALLIRGADTLGLVRIALFSPHQAKSACVHAWNAVIRETLYLGPCLDECEQRLYAETGEAMLASLRDWLQRIRSAGARKVLVDLGGNGGGTEWADEAVRMFARGPLASPFATAVRHPHTLEALEQHVTELDSAIAWPGIDARLRNALQEGRDRYATLAELAREQCDRSELWRDPSIVRDCPGTLPLELHTTGALAWLPDSAFEGAPEAAMLYAPAASRTRSGAWTGKVDVLIDGGTASASEQFVATLRDNGKARLIGARTMGAGCGYTNGGIPLVLEHSRMKIRMPDCARVRRDGTNEVFGIEPDVKVALEADSVVAAALKK